MNNKEILAKYAANRVENGMLIGLGTGSTANYFIEALARRFLCLGNDGFNWY